MNETVYLNGKFVERSKASVSPDDRGFNFADGIYEVIKYYRGIPFRYEDHLARLKRNLTEVRIAFGGTDQLAGVFRELLERNEQTEQDAGVYLQITRGSYPRMHRFPDDSSPTVFASAFPFPTNLKAVNEGIGVITADDIRWLRCDIKTVGLLPNVLYFQKAYEEGAGEVIFIRNGVVTEASHSNVLGVKDGAVYTHPDSNLILPGITKIVVREICREGGVNFVEEAISGAALQAMDELLVIGTGSEITPVVQINGTFIGGGRPGPVSRLIQKRFFEKAGKGSEFVDLFKR